MQTHQIGINAYDLGGFGDIAGAQRVASHLQHIGHSVRVEPNSKSALNKLSLLQPDVPFQIKRRITHSSKLQVDIAGHYKDARLTRNVEVPHIYVEDMDNIEDRSKVVPLYKKTGLSCASATEPMFYRPYREWDLPKKDRRDVHYALSIITEGHKLLQSAIDTTDKIAFAHVSPHIQESEHESVLDHPYFQAVQHACLASPDSYAVSLFVNPDNEEKIMQVADEHNWNTASMNGTVNVYDEAFPTLFFLSGQPQLTTTALFLSAQFPNLVTGDLSLSDAMYSVLALDGPGFYYECPPWKTPTLSSLMHMSLKGSFNCWKQLCAISIPKEFRTMDSQMFADNLSLAAETIGDSRKFERYTADQQKAIREGIKKRYGPTTNVEPSMKQLSIAAGAPYLIQDVVANLVDPLLNDTAALAQLEKSRSILVKEHPLEQHQAVHVSELTQEEIDADKAQFKGLESLLAAVEQK